MIRTLIVPIVAFALSAPDVPPDAAIDRHALLTPMEIEHSVERLADHLVEPAKNDRDKARAIFRWITDRIRYDIDALMTDHPGEVRADGVLRRKQARSGGYAALFEALARRAGLEVVTIPGYVQGMTSPDEERRIRPNHAWNAVKIEGRWQLVDVTLGAGFVRGQRFRKVLQEQFFLPPPQHLILTHLPADARWQLLPAPMHPAMWQRMPFVDQQLLSMGVTLDMLCRQMQAPGFRGFVHVHAQHSAARVWAAPLGKELAPGYDYWFVIDAPEAAQFVLVQKNRTVPLRRNGTRFEGMIRPEPGDLKLHVQRRAGDRNPGTMLTYKVNEW